LKIWREATETLAHRSSNIPLGTASPVCVEIPIALQHTDPDSRALIRTVSRTNLLKIRTN
jgi:hypothetical protein